MLTELQKVAIDNTLLMGLSQIPQPTPSKFR